MPTASNEGRLAGKVAIITGSGHGIGREEALLMAGEGARVVISDIGADDGVSRAESVAAELAAMGGTAVPFTDDIATFEGSRRAVETALEQLGGLDIVLNNAGLRAFGAIQDITEDQFDMILGSHLKATYGLIKHAAPGFIAQQSGVILNTSSESGLGHPHNTAYAAAKEGITGLTRSVARELGPLGVRCNQIRPRAMGTQAPEFVAGMARYKAEREALGRHGLGHRGDVFRPSVPENVAVLAVWLCTDAAPALNGYDFFVAGDEVGLWTEPDLARHVVHAGGWTLDLLDEHASDVLVHGLENDYLGASALVAAS
jgi:NAD(P)-dependent dehydrogenase (short-subunit alcohol dehydrogenase family)